MKYTPLYRTNRPFLFAALVFAASLSACNSNSTSPNGSGNPPPVPSPGSYSIFRVTTTSGNSWLDTFYVLNTGLSFAGKSNVMEYRVNQGPVGHYNYEANGDISHYFDESNKVGGHSGWLRLPIAGGARDSLTTTDTVLSSGVHNVTAVTASYLGAESVTVPAGTFNAVKMGYDNYSNGVHSPTVLFWVSPGIPYYVRYSNTTSSLEMISYVVK